MVRRRFPLAARVGFGDINSPLAKHWFSRFGGHPWQATEKVISLMASIDETTIAGMAYRPNVGIMLVNGKGKVWLGRRIVQGQHDETEAQASLWQMPQGGIDEGETPIMAARRELREETGIEATGVLAQTKGWLYYDLPRDMIGRALKGQYRGQKQKWFLMRFNGRDHEIDLQANGHEVEFDAWRWADIDELARLVVPFKRAVYKRVVEAFKPVIKALPDLRAKS